MKDSGFTQLSLAARVFGTMPYLIRLLSGDFPYRRYAPDLSQAQVKALMIAADDPHPTMTHLSAHLDLEKGSCTTVVDDLVAKKMVRRKVDSRDRRRVLVVLTATGKKTAQKVRRAMQAHVTAKVSLLTESQRRALDSAFTTLAEVAHALGHQTQW